MKIKWNWGTKLLISMALFMLFIIVFVVLMTQQKIDLVEKDYYLKAQEYQQRIEQVENAELLNEKVKVEIENEFMVFTFQSGFNPAEIEGTIILYRPSDVLRDIEMEIQVDSLHKHLFPLADLEKGKYIAKIEYYHNNNGYYQETPIIINTL